MDVVSLRTEMLFEQKFSGSFSGTTPTSENEYEVMTLWRFTKMLIIIIIIIIIHIYCSFDLNSESFGSPCTYTPKTLSHLP